MRIISTIIFVTLMNNAWAVNLEFQPGEKVKLKISSANAIVTQVSGCNDNECTYKVILTEYPYPIEIPKIRSSELTKGW